MTHRAFAFLARPCVRGRPFAAFDACQGGTFALFDISDDQFGKMTGVPRRELGLLAFSPSSTSTSPLQFVMPKAHKEPNAGNGMGFETFAPTESKGTIAYAFQNGMMDRLMTLNGLARVTNGGSVELTYAEEGATPQKVFETYKRRDGEWTVKYRWPLSCAQAFAIGCAVLHCPITSGLDNLPANLKEVQNRASSFEPEGSEKMKAMLMASEVSAAIGRKGKLGEAHAQMYTPMFGGETSFATALLEMLARAGLTDSERQAKALDWAEANGLTTLSAAYTLLQDPQSPAWEQLEQAVSAKAYHKMRILGQLKKATGNADGKDPQESNRGNNGPSYWAQLRAR